MEPNVWGPPTWRTLHYVALGYPAQPTPQDADAYRAFFRAVGPVLPCAACSLHYQEHLRDLPLEPFLGRGGPAEGGLFAWTVLLHNQVNQRTGKPAWSLQRAAEEYSNPHAAAVLRASAPDAGPGAAGTLALATGIAFVMLLAIFAGARWSRARGRA